MKGVIYTAIAGAFDDLVAPLHRLPGVDYLCFSDGRVSPTAGWRIRPFGWSHDDPNRVAKRVKILPHRYLGEYDWSLWVDGNVHITGDLSAFLAEHLGRSPMHAFRHPRRSCIYAEAVHCIQRSKDCALTIDRQVNRYRRALMPRDFGLSENNILLRMHGDRLLRRLMEHWWGEIAHGSRRDQLSLSYVLWRNGLAPCFFFAGEKILDELPLFSRVEHRH